MRRQNNNYYFSVEGDTEKYYLEHLRTLINNDESRICNVSFKIKITDSPKSFVKGTKTLEKLDFYHITDIESLEEYHINHFKDQLSEMKDVKVEISPRVKSYSLGYTNFTFELWMIFHKKDCFGAFNHRRDYLSEINKAYNKSFERINEFKNERTFKAILDDITLNDVKEAIRRSEVVMSNLERNGYTKKKYKGYKYYEENPSLSLHEIIKKILNDVGLI